MPILILSKAINQTHLPFYVDLLLPVDSHQAGVTDLQNLPHLKRLYGNSGSLEGIEREREAGWPQELIGAKRGTFPFGHILNSEHAMLVSVSCPLNGLPVHYQDKKSLPAHPVCYSSRKGVE